jgi:hypothetical protein
VAESKEIAVSTLRCVVGMCARMLLMEQREIHAMMQTGKAKGHFRYPYAVFQDMRSLLL